MCQKAERENTERKVKRNDTGTYYSSESLNFVKPKHNAYRRGEGVDRQRDRERETETETETETDRQRQRQTDIFK